MARIVPCSRVCKITVPEKERQVLGEQRRQRSANALIKKGVPMFLALFAVLIVLWLLGFLAFHVAGGLIHLLLIFAVISLVLHFVRGSRTA
jgi:mannose/fructose/N-acetylgalactosamine-specific phosphotransferase system component IID